MSNALFEEVAIVVVVSTAILITITQACNCEPYTTSSLTGYPRVLELLNGNEQHIIDNLGICSHVFLHLVSAL
jgi:hypothetical protein